MVQTMRMDSWMALMESTNLFSLDFTPPQAQTCYMWARMSTVDELKVGTSDGSRRNPVMTQTFHNPSRALPPVLNCAGLHKA